MKVNKFNAKASHAAMADEITPSGPPDYLTGPTGATDAFATGATDHMIY